MRDTNIASGGGAVGKCAIFVDCYFYVSTVLSRGAGSYTLYSPLHSCLYGHEKEGGSVEITRTAEYIWNV